jgi:hypothetical protein
MKLRLARKLMPQEGDPPPCREDTALRAIARCWKKTCLDLRLSRKRQEEVFEEVRHEIRLGQARRRLDSAPIPR